MSDKLKQEKIKKIKPNRNAVVIEFIKSNAHSGYDQVIHIENLNDECLETLKRYADSLIK